MLDCKNKWKLPLQTATVFEHKLILSPILNNEKGTRNPSLFSKVIYQFTDEQKECARETTCCGLLRNASQNKRKFLPRQYRLIKNFVFADERMPIVNRWHHTHTHIIKLPDHYHVCKWKKVLIIRSTEQRAELHKKNVVFIDRPKKQIWSFHKLW